MGSPLWGFLWDSLLFDNHLIKTAFADTPESDLREELSKYIDYAAKAAPEVQASLQQPTLGPVLATGARLRPWQMLVQGAFYIDRVVMDDPMFEVAASALQDRIVAGELFKTEPSPVNRTVLAWVARYMKDLTSMVVGNYVVFLPINRGIGFASEVLPLRAISNQEIIPPPQVLELLTARMRMKPGTIDVPSMTGRVEDRSALWVEFEGLQGSSWYHTSSNSDPVLALPSTEELTRILQTPTEIGKADWVIAQAAKYAMKQAYQQIMGEVSVANLVNAAYATEAPLAFDVLKSAGLFEPSKEQQTGRAVLDLRMPFLANVDPTALMRIREDDRDSFRTFQHRLEAALRELREEPDQGKREQVIAEVAEEAAAEMDRIQRTVKGARKSAALDMAVDVALATVTAAVLKPDSYLLTVGTVAASSLIRGARRASSQKRDNDWFFLWKVLKKSRS